MFRYPYRIKMLDNIAIVHDLHNADFYLHAFALPEWRLITSFAPRGEGPNEMLLCETLQFNSLDSIWALDSRKMNIIRYSLNIENESIHKVEQINLDIELERALDFYVRENDIILTDYSGKYRYHIVNLHGNLIESCGVIPQESDLNINRALAMGWRPFLDYNPQSGNLAMATQFGDVIEVYNLNDTISTIKYGPVGEPEFELVEHGNSFPSNIMGFTDVVITDNYIYAPYNGTTFKEIMEEVRNGRNPIDGAYSIYVFDHEINPVRIYKLDRPIMTMSINEKEGYFYATDINSDESILKYRF